MVPENETVYPVTESPDVLFDLNDTTKWARRIEENSQTTITLTLGNQPYRVCICDVLNQNKQLWAYAFCET